MKSYSEWKNQQLVHETFSAKPPYIPTEPSSVSPQRFQTSVNNRTDYGTDNRGRNQGESEEVGGHATLSYGLPVRRRSFKEYVKLREDMQSYPGQPQQPPGVRPPSQMGAPGATPPPGQGSPAGMPATAGPPGQAGGQTPAQAGAGGKPIGPGNTPTPGDEEGAPQQMNHRVITFGKQLAQKLKTNPDELLPVATQIVQNAQVATDRTGAKQGARQFSMNAQSSGIGRKNLRQVAGGNMDSLQQPPAV